MEPLVTSMPLKLSRFPVDGVKVTVKVPTESAFSDFGFPDVVQDDDAGTSENSTVALLPPVLRMVTVLVVALPSSVIEIDDGLRNWRAGVGVFSAHAAGRNSEAVTPTARIATQRPEFAVRTHTTPATFTPVRHANALRRGRSADRARCAARPTSPARPGCDATPRRPRDGCRTRRSGSS